MIDAETTTALLAAAHDATRQAYVPYSQFPVGAAILTEDGTIYAGCNIENASFGLSVCAERVAIFKAIADGHRVVRAVAVVATKVDAVTPCGACRQVLNEFVPANQDLVVIMERQGAPEPTPLPELLPRAFGPRDLPEA